MTHIDYRGRPLNKPAMKDCTFMDWYRITEEVLCEIINKGLARPTLDKEDIKAIGRVLELVKKLSH